jgi:hypothetical protein
MGASGSTTDNTQIANSNLLQTYSGTCDITCDNKISDSSVVSINSHIGGNLGVSQTCAVNGQCSFDVTQSALSDTVFKANLAAVSSPTIGNFNWSSSRSYQEINQYINQITIQKCGIHSINTINNVDVYAVNSDITGNVGIGQAGQATGGCAMKTVMDATALASGTTDICSSAGKKGKKSCGKKSGKSLGSILIYGGAALVIFVIIMIAYRYFAGKKLPPCTSKTPPGTKCKPPKGHLENLPMGRPPYGSEIGQEYIPPLGASVEGQVYEGPLQQGLQMTPAEEPRQFTPQYLEAIGEN